MGNCKILNCRTKKGEQSHFNVPQTQPIRSEWIKQIERHQIFDETIKIFPVCALHFQSDEITKNGFRTTLKKGSVPTIFPSNFGTNIFMPFEDEVDVDLNTTQTKNLLEIQPVLMESVAESFNAMKTKPKNDVFTQKENERPVDDSEMTKLEMQTKTINSCTEYSRLLQNDVKNIKLTELVNAKSQQIKTLLAYYRKKAMKRPASGEENEEQAEPELPVKCKDIL